MYRGVRLAQAGEWAQSHQNDVNLLEREFLAASQAQIEKEEAEREAQRRRELEAAQRLAETERARAEEQSLASRRLRSRAVYLTIALLMVAGLALVASWLWQQSVQANRLGSSRELSAAATNNLQIDPERSALLALQALRSADTLEARNALHQAITELHLLKNIPAHAGDVPDVVYSPDGRWIASLGASGQIKIWDALTGEALQTLENPTSEFGSSLAFSPDGSSLAAAYFTQVVLWDTQNWEIQDTLAGQTVGTTSGYNLGVGQIAFCSGGERLALANLDGVSKVWDLTTHGEVRSLAVPEEPPANAIACSPDTHLIATAGDAGIVRVWDGESGTTVFTRTLGGIIHAISFSPDGVFLAAASEDGRIMIWEAGNGTLVSGPPRQSGLYDVAFLADGRLATAGQDGTVRVWDATSGQQVLLLAGPTSTVISVAGSPDGQRVISGAYDGSLRIWDASPGKELLAIPAHAGIVWNAGYSPDGTKLASASVDGSIKLWDVDTGKLLVTFPEGGDPGGGFCGLAFSPDGKRLATGSLDGSVTIWDSQSGASQQVLQGHTNMVIGLAFSPDGMRLATASWDGSAKVWDLVNEKALVTYSGHRPTAMISGVIFHPDGKSVFTSADDQFVYRWDARTGEQLQSFSGEGKELYGLALSPDGTLLAAGDQDGNIHLWDMDSAQAPRVLQGHAGLALRLAFSPDGTKLASAGFDRLAKVWDVKNGSEIFSLYGNTSNVFGVSFSPDGRQLATAGADGSLRTFTLDLDQLIALAQSRLTRTLTAAECQKYLHTETCPK